ncbi:MAG: competence protein ComK [bacterium]
MKNYILNNNTCAVIATYSGCTIIDNKGNTLLEERAYNLLKYNCEHYGCSYNDRVTDSKSLLNASYKLPIVINDKDNFIMFPTSSFRCDSCSWINIGMVDKYYQQRKNKTVVIFKNKQKIILDISYFILEKQIMRASRMISLLPIE